MRKLKERYEQLKEGQLMILLHGSPTNGLPHILPIARTKNAGPSDPDRLAFRDVVFLSSDWETARKYSGAEGSVYVVEAEEAQHYAEAYATRPPAHKSRSQNKKKIQKLTGRPIFVAPEARVLCEIPGRLYWGKHKERKKRDGT